MLKKKYLGGAHREIGKLEIEKMKLYSCEQLWVAEKRGSKSDYLPYRSTVAYIFDGKEIRISDSGVIMMTRMMMMVVVMVVLMVMLMFQGSLLPRWFVLSQACERKRCLGLAGPPHPLRVWSMCLVAA